MIDKLLTKLEAMIDNCIAKLKEKIKKMFGKY